MAVFTSVTLRVWPRDYAGITKGEADILELRFYGAWYIRRNIPRDLKL